MDTTTPDLRVDAPPEAARIAWAHALDRPALHDLPYKVETDAAGRLVLSPHRTDHTFVQGTLFELLLRHVEAEGKVSTELAVATPEGVKVVDVIWISAARRAQIPDGAVASPVMPEICVEVLSPTNTDAEMDAKRRLYLDGGAEEVWLCDAQGRMRFYDAEGPRTRSRLAPTFPARVERRGGAPAGG
jgi:hypothetical protein